MTQTAPAERRKRMRLALHWEARIRKPGSDAEVRAETRDVSSEGFYCVSPEPFSPGQRVDCAIAIPAPSASGRQHNMHCHCTVVRLERIRGHLFGVACRIDEYSVSSGQTY
jgi:hypothetical protein